MKFFSWRKKKNTTTHAKTINVWPVTEINYVCLWERKKERSRERETNRKDSPPVAIKFPMHCTMHIFKIEKISQCSTITVIYIGIVDCIESLESPKKNEYTHTNHDYKQINSMNHRKSERSNLIRFVWFKLYVALLGPREKCELIDLS